MLQNLDERTRAALKFDMVVDITTRGRNTGKPRRIEIWAHYIEGKAVITGSPGRRSWYANLVSSPDFTLHLKDDLVVDVPARARAVTDEDERRELLSTVKAASRFEQRMTMEVDEWVEGSCLVEVTFGA